MVEFIDAEVVADSPRCGLGESPVWDDRTGLLYWIDIEGRRLHSLDAAGTVRSVPLSQTVTSIGLSTQGPLVGTSADGFAMIDVDGTVTRLGDGLGLPAGDRMNDGGCDPAGRYWAGSMNATGGAGTASLWRIDAEGRIRRILDGVTESNGLAWPTADADAPYYVDTAQQRIDRLIVTATGAVGSREPVITFDEDEGAPDGLTVDADGNLWVALWGSGRVRQIRPDGTTLCEVRVPATSCSNIAFFGGEGRWRLAITTALEDVSPEQRAADDRHGALFVADVPAQGTLGHRFRSSGPGGAPA
jgi:sugar lactone lactonase YvrE